MKRKISCIIAVAFLFVYFLMPVAGYDDNPIKLIINGRQINTEAKVINGKVYAPVNVVAESLGAKSSWDTKANTVSIQQTAAVTKSTDEIVPEVVKTVSPSVVGIIGNWKFGDSAPDSTKYIDAIIHGTGVIVKSTGEILTNAHVVKEMDKIVVVLADGSGYQARIKCIDEESDLALIKIAKTGLQPAKFGKEEDIVIGKTVIAIGTPASFSLRNSATIGIISGVNRSIDSSYRLIQTDAAINPGNSGGPLVDLKGEVIGINSSKFSGVGIEGMGFSIPLNTINYVMGHFEKYGKVKRPYLGTTFEEDWAAQIGLPSNNGLAISKVDSGSPAEAQGLKPGDVIISINEVKINSCVDYNELMKKYLPKDTATIKFKRNGIIQNVKVVFGEK